MLNRSTAWATLLLVATFAAGMVVGVGGRALWVRAAYGGPPERAPGALAAQGQPLAVTLGDAIRRALDVQPAMVQARGTARNAGAGERSAWGAFLPTVNTSASASRSNQTRFDPNSTNTLPPVYSYAGGLSASVVLFDGFNRFANLRASSATQDAPAAGPRHDRSARLGARDRARRDASRGGGPRGKRTGLERARPVLAVRHRLLQHQSNRRRIPGPAAVQQLPRDIRVAVRALLDAV